MSRPQHYVRRSKKYDFAAMDEIEIFQKVLSGEIKRFPQNFWSCVDSDHYAPKIVRYLIEEILHWNSEDVKKKLRKKTFYKYKLSGMICAKYRSSPYLVISHAYPEREYKPWDFVNSPNSYWQGEEGRQHGIEAIRWLFEEKLEWTEEEIKKNGQSVFAENDLIGMIRIAFDSNMFEAINAAYPGRFKPWEIGLHVPNSYWTKEKGIQAVKWLIEEKLQWNEEEVKQNLTKSIFKEHGLYGMIQRCFESSPYQALNETYPGRYKPWSFARPPMGYWTEETCFEAFRWLVEEVKGYKTIEEVKENMTMKDLQDHGMYALKGRYGIKHLIKMYEAYLKEGESLDGEILL